MQVDHLAVGVLVADSAVAADSVVVGLGVDGAAADSAAPAGDGVRVAPGSVRARCIPCGAEGAAAVGVGAGCPAEADLSNQTLNECRFPFGVRPPTVFSASTDVAYQIAPFPLCGVGAWDSARPPFSELPAEPNLEFFLGFDSSVVLLSAPGRGLAPSLPCGRTFCAVIGFAPGRSAGPSFVPGCCSSMTRITPCTM